MVNVARRLAADAYPGRIQVDRTAHNRLRDDYLFESSFTTRIEGKGEMPE